MRRLPPEGVAAAGLCTGCGLCAAEAGSAVTMVTSPGGHLRPRQSRPLTRAEQARFDATCPGILVDGARRPSGPRTSTHWGPLLAVHEAWAADPAVRFRGSSGGALTALASFLLASGRAAFVAQVGASAHDPHGTAVRVSRTAAEAHACAGSRYAPSAPLAEIGRHLDRGEPFVFVGKPCDLVGLANLATVDPRVDELVVARLSFFCAGVPSRHGSVALGAAVGVAPEELQEVVYRGEGWPGATQLRLHDASVRTLTYEDAWGRILGPTLQFRCKICPDGTGEFADIACGDAWTIGPEGPTFDEEPGRSMVAVRSARGAELLAAAVDAGFVQLGRTLDETAIDAAQPSQLRRKRAVAWRLLGVPTLGGVPRFRRLGLLRSAAEEHGLEGVRATAGTFRRRHRREATP